MLHPGLLLNERYHLIKQLGRGGFGETWEIEVEGQVKVLKVLLEDFPKAIELLQREADVLSHLQHPGIPRADANSYFCCTVDDQQDPIHGYVMERVSGVTLLAWMEDRNGQSISANQMMDWLTQLSEILIYLHQHGFLHRDIKPSNIMLKEDGQLVLIDFGGVKEAATTQLQNQLGDSTGTRLATQGYTPTEQLDGHAVEQSDFFALGRTCTYLLTGKQPTAFKSTLGKLLWRSSAPMVHPELANFVDELMEPFPYQRPQNAQAILARLPLLRRVLKSAEPIPVEQRSMLRSVQSFLYAPSVVSLPVRLLFSGLSSAVVIAMLLLLRSTGSLQFFELKTYDYLLRARSLEPIDERLVIVTADEDDRDFQESLGMSFFGNSRFNQSIADAALEQALTILEKHQPRAIGLDINLDYLTQNPPDAAARTSLVNYLQQAPNLMTTCRVGDNDSLPFPGANLTQLSFANVQRDRGDEVVRRHLTHGPFTQGSVCTTEYSLSLLLANSYLEKEGISADPNAPDGFTFYQDGDEMTPTEVVLKDEVLPAIAVGGYQRRLDPGGIHLFLNYRAVSNLTNIAPRLSLRAVLTEEFDSNLLRDRIVLIGVDRPDDPGNNDYWLTPFGQEIAGVFIHAHQTSQLVSAVLDDRPLITVKPQRTEILIIVVATLIGGATAILSTRFSIRLLTYLAISATYAALSLIFLINGLWLPVFPSVIGLSGAFFLSVILLQSKATRLFT